uniref:X-box-binding protein 1 n=1 Tax=Moniliophthora roreri TaxID=221103 RepID=A0A0W0F022_MONRR
MSSHKSEPHSPSPSPSTSTSNPRKRPRSEISSEERKEARAHRNRIAAQNSRDRRKAQFAYLERRVVELEEENKRLRAGLPPTTSPDTQEDSAAKDRENQELRARIASLERGLEVVVKAFTAQGTVLPADASQSVLGSLKLSEPSPAPTNTTTTNTTSTTLSSSTPIDEPTSSSTPTTHSMAPAYPISPAPSHTSLDFSFSSTSTTSPDLVATGGDHAAQRVPAAGELEPQLQLNPSFDDTKTTFSAPITTPQEPVVDDATMESLFREIVCASPGPEKRSESLPSFDLFNSTGEGQVQTSASLQDQTTVTNQMDLGLGISMDLGLEGITGFGNMDTIESTEGGFTATWLEGGDNLFDYTTLLLEGVADSSAPPMMPLMSLLSESVEVA